MQVVMLAGEQALIAGPQGDPQPASLASIQGRPLVDWQLDAFVASGVQSVVMLVGPSGEEIEAHVRRALDRGLMVAYSYAGAEPLGSGSAVRRAYARLQEEFVLTRGDYYVPFDYTAPLRDLREHPDAVATIALLPKPAGARGHASVDGNWVTRYDSGRAPDLDYVDAGIVALRRAALADIADGAVWDIEALWRKLAREQKLRAFLLPDRRYDVRTEDSRRELEQHLRRQPLDGPSP